MLKSKIADLIQTDASKLIADEPLDISFEDPTIPSTGTRGFIITYN
jgi:hypothetical protein